MLTISRAAFTEWLLKHENDEVGTPTDCDVCPLATYLTEQHKRLVRAFPFVLHIASSDERLTAPVWAREFMETLDDVYGNTKSVTGQMCLEILHDIGGDLNARHSSGC